jgi:hypothetical protein
MIGNKRGVTWKAFLWVGLVVVVIIALAFFISTPAFETLAKGISFDSTVKGFDTYYGKPIGNVMNWVFGGVPAWLDDKVGSTSAVIVTILVWLLLFVTFGDIIHQFSTFSSPVAWISALALSIIAANLKAIVVLMAFFIGIFAFLGAFAVLAGLFAAFAVFFAVNWGVGSLGPWVMRRKAMMFAEKEDIKSQQKASSVKSAIKGMADIGEELAR